MKLCLIPLAICLIAIVPTGHAAVPSGLRAGAAISNITPELGSSLVGGFVPAPSTHVHDELNARCLVLDDGRTKLALVVCDLLGLHRSVSVEARRLIEEATGIPPSHVMISATHTHSAAPAVGVNFFEVEQPLDDYQRFVARRIADGVRRAVNNMRPARIGFGTVLASEYPKNRRWYMREGSKALINPFGKTDRVKMNPPVADPDLLEPAGPIDPTLSFVAVTGVDGKPISVYASYSIHYVGGTSNGHISADYFGVFSEALKRSLEAPDSEIPFVAMMANGTSGDVATINRLRVEPKTAPYQRMREVGEALAARVTEEMAKVSWQTQTSLDVRFQELPIRWRAVEPELLEWANTIVAMAPRLERGPIPFGADHATSADYVVPLVYALRLQRISKAIQPNQVALQAIRIGDVCIFSTPCEVFAETGLEFKRRSPFRNSFMVGLNHGFLAYLPTRRHYELGGYETWPGKNFLEQEASAIILEAGLKMAGDLYATKSRE